MLFFLCVCLSERPSPTLLWESDLIYFIKPLIRNLILSETKITDGDRTGQTKTHDGQWWVWCDGACGVFVVCINECVVVFVVMFYAPSPCPHQQPKHLFNITQWLQPVLQLVLGCWASVMPTDLLKFNPVLNICVGSDMHVWGSTDFMAVGMILCLWLSILA